MTSAVLTLAITSVTDKNGVIPNGGTTKETRFVVKGTAVAGASIQVSDGSFVIETNYADFRGEWTTKEISRPVGERHLLVKSSGLVSKPYIFTILASK